MGLSVDQISTAGTFLAGVVSRRGQVTRDDVAGVVRQVAHPSQPATLEEIKAVYDWIQSQSHLFSSPVRFTANYGVALWSQFPRRLSPAGLRPEQQAWQIMLHRFQAEHGPDFFTKIGLEGEVLTRTPDFYISFLKIQAHEETGLPLIFLSQLEADYSHLKGRSDDKNSIEFYASFLNVLRGYPIVHSSSMHQVVQGKIAQLEKEASQWRTLFLNHGLLGNRSPHHHSLRGVHYYYRLNQAIKTLRHVDQQIQAKQSSNPPPPKGGKFAHIELVEAAGANDVGPPEADTTFTRPAFVPRIVGNRVLVQDCAEMGLEEIAAWLDMNGLESMEPEVVQALKDAVGNRDAQTVSHIMSPYLSSTIGVRPAVNSPVGNHPGLAVGSLVTGAEFVSAAAVTLR